MRSIVLRDGVLTIEHWTPLNDLSSDEAASPGYRHALSQQHSVPDLPYGLGVWHAGKRVMRLLWSDAGALEIVQVTRSAWEAELLALWRVARAGAASRRWRYPAARRQPEAVL